ncbi:MAG: YchF/TatD family DNA exonuclease [Nitrospinota bacterium]|jgi:TatD DNase family protein|nr:YchF/TatD family DNA exonuclease [Nitrospinota bacterium]MDP7664698.1 YchF/TatD family DNA exonuclease [Nitrospinota bacterium]
MADSDKPEQASGGQPKNSGARDEGAGGRPRRKGSGRRGGRPKNSRRRGRGQRGGPTQSGRSAQGAPSAGKAVDEKAFESIPLVEGAAILVDSHAHIDASDYDGDRRKILERALSKGVGTIIAVGSDLDSSRKTVDIANSFEEVFAAVGVHPHDVKSVANKSAGHIKVLADNAKVVAIGEIGLDYHYDHSPRKLQKHWFREQIRMAVKIGKPVIVHCRDAGEDVFSILEEERVWRVGGVVHCFTGDAELARKFLGLDLHLGVAGPITFENSDELRSVFADVPIERILVETDSPYLTPSPNRGKRNEPAYTVQVAEKLAEIKGLTLEDVARATSVNVRRLFKIGPCPVPGTIAYPLSGKLYLNITNRCYNACLFCGLLSDRVFVGHDLTLESDPGVEAILEAAGDPDRYEEVVFSGYGEPTTRLEELKQVALELRGRGAKRIRLATNGLGNRVNGRSILPELLGLIDAISVSLQAESPEAYEKVCKTKEIENPYPSVKEFVSEAKRLFGDVEVTAVDMPGIIDIEACEKVAREELNVSFRRHSFVLAD